MTDCAVRSSDTNHIMCVVCPIGSPHFLLCHMQGSTLITLIPDTVKETPDTIEKNHGTVTEMPETEEIMTDTGKRMIDYREKVPDTGN